MSDEKKQNTFLDNMAVMMTAENFQKYILGTKKNGDPRAVYDVVKDVAGLKKKKKKGKKHKKNDSKPTSSYSFYLDTKKGKKKKKKHNKSKHWHI